MKRDGIPASYIAHLFAAAADFWLSKVRAPLTRVVRTGTADAEAGGVQQQL